MSSDEPMVMLTCRVPAMLRDRLNQLAAATGAADRSEVVRRLLADGTRRALAAASHPARLPGEPAGAPPDPLPAGAVPELRGAAAPARRDLRGLPR